MHLPIYGIMYTTKHSLSFDCCYYAAHTYKVLSINLAKLNLEFVYSVYADNAEEYKRQWSHD